MIRSIRTGSGEGAHEAPLILPEIKAESQEISMRQVTSAPAGAEVYLIRSGDTFWGIAERFTGNSFNDPRIIGN